MISIDKPKNDSTAVPGTSVAVECTSGTPVRCTVNAGGSTITHQVGTGPGKLPLSQTPDGGWGFSLPLPNVNGSCVIMVISQNDKDDSVRINLQAGAPPGPGQLPVSPVVPGPLDDEDD